MTARAHSHNFTVVIPAYNAASTVCRAIDSVLSQSFPANEIILIDDGSTDDLKAQLKKYPIGISYEKQSHQGSSVARQRGTELATSEYIAYLDADDWWPDDKLESLNDILCQENVDFLFADLNRAITSNSEDTYLPRNTTFFQWATPLWKSKPAESGYSDLYRLEKDKGLGLFLAGYPVYPSTMLISRKAIEQVGGWDPRFRRAQDLDMSLRLARHYPVYFLNKVHATLGIHDGNNNAIDYVIKQTDGDIKVLKAHAEAATKDPNYRAKVLKALSKKYCGLGYTRRLKVTQSWLGSATTRQWFFPAIKLTQP